MRKIAKRLTGGAKNNLMGRLHDLSGQPGYYSFANGLPNAGTFPVEEMTQAAAQVLDTQWNDALQYNDTDQYEPLKQMIVDRYKKFGLYVTTKDILITSSSAQALDICAKTFLNPGDKAIVEKPTYMGAINAFRVYNADMIEVPLHGDGLDLEILEEQLKKNPKITYLLPTFQNPTGLTYSVEKRKQVAEILKKSNTIVLEDDPYGELRFYGEHLPMLKTFLGDQCLVLGTFSKIVCPGMRLGWICCTDPKLMASLYTVKRQCDIAAEGISLRAMSNYYYNWDFDEHIAKACQFYKTNADAMMEEIEKWFPKEVTYYKAEGGLYIWCELPEYMNATPLFDAASAKKVLFFPGSPFYVHAEDGEHTIRLSYCCTDIPSIKTGIKMLGEAMTEIVDAHNSGKDQV